MRECHSNYQDLCNAIMSRLTSMGRTPISERIKVFDASSSPKKTPPRTPSRPREPSITPSVDLKPVPARSAQPGNVRDPVKPTDGLRRVDKVNRGDSSNGSQSRSSNVTRADSTKTRVTRTDSIKSTTGSGALSSISTSSRKAVTGVSSSSPRVGKKPLTAASQPVGKGKASPQNSNTKNASGSSSSSKTTTSRSSISSKTSPSANSQQGRPAPGHKKEEQPKSSSGSNQDVKPDVIADIEHDRATSEDVTNVGGEGEGGAETLPVVFPPPDSASTNVGAGATITEEAPCDDERQAPELVTAKLIRDMRGDEAVSQEVTRDAGDDENCDNHEKKEELDASLSRRESVDEQVKKKSIIVNVEEAEQPRKESVTIQGDESQITKKKSLMEVEAESPYLRKKSLKEAMLDSSSSSYNSMRKTSLVSSSKSYMRKESVKEQLEDLVDKQYFTKQALNNATSTTINQVIKTS